VGLNLLKNDNNVIFDATSNYRRFRDTARARIPNFAEVYLKCPIPTCMQREFKRDENRAYSIYKQKEFVPGVDVGYQEPENPEITIETNKTSPKESVDKILQELGDFFK
jgi:adenylylsulfate kinase